MTTNDLEKEWNRVLDLFAICSSELAKLESEHLNVNGKIIAKRTELETIQFQLDMIRKERLANRKKK